MEVRGINRFSVDSIQDFDDVKTWARDQEILVEKLRDEITELRDTDDEQQKGISRNLKLLRTAAIVFGSAFAVVVVLFGILLISGRFL